jgi:ATP-dependent DNA ligase
MFAMGFIRKGSGLAMRFPTFTGSYRLGKSAEDAATARAWHVSTILFEPLS